MIRQPAVANQFYTGDTQRLRAELDTLIVRSAEPEQVIGVISPHAGYIYSGAVAGALFGAIAIPRTVLILGPNHHGLGARVSLYPAGAWHTPLGNVPIDETLAALVRRHAPMAEEETSAHQREHSLEVQVPFLQHLQPELAIVPICLGFGDYATCRQLGEGIAAAIREYGAPVLMVASSDMTHYESATVAREKDDMALERALALDAEGLLAVCRSRRITMCGVVPSTVMLVAAKALGASEARLVRYANSGDTNGDYEQVVGYAAVAVW